MNGHLKKGECSNNNTYVCNFNQQTVILVSHVLHVRKKIQFKTCTEKAFSTLIMC